MIEPAPLPLLTLPALILEFFISLSWSEGLNLTPLDYVAFVPAPVSKLVLLEDAMAAMFLPVGGAPPPDPLDS